MDNIKILLLSIIKMMNLGCIITVWLMKAELKYI